MAKQKMRKFTSLLLTSVAGAVFSISASASIQYSFTGGGGTDVTGDTFTSSGTGPSVTVTGWSNTGSGSGDANRLLETGTVKMWSGLGVTNRLEGDGSPNHSTDNAGRTDSILFSFTDEIELQGLSIGWKGNDSDVTVLAYTGAGAPTVAGNTYGGLTASGWQIVDHEADLSVGVNRSINSGGISSSYWLVGAYNPLVGSSPGWSTGNDYVKISALTGVTPPPGCTGGNCGGEIPEPSSIALLTLGLFAAWYYRRRETEARPQLGHALAC